MLPDRRAGSAALQGTKIWFVSVAYAPEKIGSGPYASATAERLAAEGADVTVLTGLPHYPAWRLEASDRWRLRRQETVHQVRVVRLRHMVPRRQNVLTRGLYELSFWIHGLLTGDIGERPDVVVVVTPSLGGALVGLHHARRLGVPLVVQVHDLSSAAVLQSGIRGGRLVSLLTRRLEGRLLRAGRAVTVVHEAFLPRCLEMGVDLEDLYILPTWTLEVPVTPPDGSLAPDLGWQGRFVVLHAGNMGFKQGLDVVVEAARLAHQRGERDVLFVLMGDGNQRDHLARRAGGLPTLRFINLVGVQHLAYVLSSADVLLVTQRTEVHDMSIPSKLTAYFAAGRVVVGSVAAGGAAADEIRRSGAGVLVPPQDPEALLEEVLRLRQSSTDAQRLGQLGRVYSLERPSADQSLDRIVELVRRTLEASA